MLGYHTGATSVASLLPSFSVPPATLSGLEGLVSSAVSPLVGVGSVVSGVGDEVAGLASTVPLSSVTSVAQIAMYPRA